MSRQSPSPPQPGVAVVPLLVPEESVAVISDVVCPSVSGPDEELPEVVPSAPPLPVVSLVVDGLVDVAGSVVTSSVLELLEPPVPPT